MLKIIILLLTAGIYSCGKINEKTELKPRDKDLKKEIQGNDTKNTSTNLKDDETIIEVGTHMEWVFGKDYKSWRPSGEDIEKSRQMIRKCFEDQEDAYVNRVLNRKPEDYCKQYVGAVNSNGERILWINMFCKKEIEMFKKWKTDILFVADGGNCFLQIKFNWEKNDGHYEFKVNGGP